MSEQNAEDVRYQMPFIRWRAMADELAQALVDGTNDGNGLTESGREALSRYHRLIGGPKGGFVSSEDAYHVKEGGCHGLRQAEQ